MAYEPHYRVSMNGTLGGGSEIFSCNLSIAQVGYEGFITALLSPNDAVWQDVADDCQAWFANPDAKIHSSAVLQQVKIAPIGANGLYEAPAVELPRVQAGAGSNVYGRPRNDSALACTLHTAGDLGRVKGRIFAPLPAMTVEADGRFAESEVEQAETAFKTLINNLNNQPGLDVLDLDVVVASQGRGSTVNGVYVQTRGPENYLVTGVSVGRVPDTQRRRRNKLPESRDVSTL